MKELGLFISIFVFGILLPPVGIALFVLWYFWYVMGYAGITKGEDKEQSKDWGDSE